MGRDHKKCCNGHRHHTKQEVIIEKESAGDECINLGLFGFGDFHGFLLGRPAPSHQTRAGEITNVLVPPDASQSSYTAEKFLDKGGLPRIQTLFKEFCANDRYDEHLAVMSGDLFLGTPEALFSQGQTLVKAINRLGTDKCRLEYVANGNWDFVYGQKVFTYVYNHGDTSLAEPNQPDFLPPPQVQNPEWLNAKTLSLNLYREVNGVRTQVLPGWDVKIYPQKCGPDLRVGIVGLTTERRVALYEAMLGDLNTPYGYHFDGNNNIGIPSDHIYINGIIDDRLIATVRMLYFEQKCNTVVLLSEFGLMNNLRLADLEQLSDTPISLIFSSDMHEAPRITDGARYTDGIVSPRNGTIIVEPGCCGEYVMEAALKFKREHNRYKLIGKRAKMLEVGPFVNEDRDLRNYIDQLLLKSFPPGSVLQFPLIETNIPGNEITCDGVAATLNMKINRDDIFPTRSMAKSIDQVPNVLTDGLRFGLYRYAFSTHPYKPALAEGTSHDLLTECMRKVAKCQIGTIRGFRYGMWVEAEGNLSRMSEVTPDNQLIKTLQDGYGPLGNGKMSYSDLFNGLAPSFKLGRGFMSGQRILTAMRNSVFLAANGNSDNWRGGWFFGWAGLRVTFDKKNLQDLRNGVLKGSSELIIDIKVLKSWDADVFDENNYESLKITTPPTYYSIASHTTGNYTAQVNNIPLDRVPQSCHLIDVPLPDGVPVQPPLINPTTIVQDPETPVGQPPQLLSAAKACYIYLRDNFANNAARKAFVDKMSLIQIMRVQENGVLLKNLLDGPNPDYYKSLGFLMMQPNVDVSRHQVPLTKDLDTVANYLTSADIH